MSLSNYLNPLQVTTEGLLVFDMDSTHKKPYETLILGRLHGKGYSSTRNYPSAGEELTGTKVRPNEQQNIDSLNEDGVLDPLSDSRIGYRAQDHSSLHMEKQECSISVYTQQNEESSVDNYEPLSSNSGGSSSLPEATSPVVCDKNISAPTDKWLSKKPRLSYQEPRVEPLLVIPPSHTPTEEHASTLPAVPYQYVFICVPSKTHSQKPYIGGK